MRFAIAKVMSKGRVPVFTVATLLAMLLIGSATLYAADTIQLRWEFDEANGSTATDSSGPNTATLYNNPTRVAGYTGTAVSLNGVNQYVQSNTQVASLGQADEPYALSAWVQVPSGASSGNIIHISSSNTGGNWCIPFLRLQGGVFQATGWDGNSVSAIGTTTVLPNQWYQVLTTWDPINGLRLFVNGVLEDSSPQSTFDAYGSPVYVSVGLGNNSCSENQGYLRGVVDDVRVYDRVIEAADIVDINNPVPAAVIDDGNSDTPGAADEGAVQEPGAPLPPNTGVEPKLSIQTWVVGILVMVSLVALGSSLRFIRVKTNQNR